MGLLRTAVTDVLAVKVVIRVPVQVLLVAAADKMAARHDTFLDVTFAATFNTTATLSQRHDEQVSHAVRTQ